MSRFIDITKPLSDEDRQYMLDRGLEQKVAALDAQFAGEDTDPNHGLPAGVTADLPQTNSPDVQVPPAAGAATDPTEAGAAAADAFNGSAADGADGDEDDEDDEPEAVAPTSKRKR